MNNIPAPTTTPAPRPAPKFDADLSPRATINRDTAVAHKLRYDPRKRAYVDEDGCLIRDRFGQRL